jgi:hypothetical protein
MHIQKMRIRTYHFADTKAHTVFDYVTSISSNRRRELEVLHSTVEEISWQEFRRKNSEERQNKKRVSEKNRVRVFSGVMSAEWKVMKKSFLS